MPQSGGAFLPNEPTFFSNPTTGAVEIATGPKFPFYVQAITLTGATGSAAASVTSVWPAILHLTGATGGVNLPTGAGTGAAFFVSNMSTGAANIYAVGDTINGTTGTTAFSLTATGNKFAFIYLSATGAWQAKGNT